MKNKLQSFTIPYDGLSESQVPVLDPTMKYLEVLLSVDDANRLDKALKYDTTLSWFVSIFPLKRTNPIPLMSLKPPPLHVDVCE